MNRSQALDPKADAVYIADVAGQLAQAATSFTEVDNDETNAELARLLDNLISEATRNAPLNRTMLAEVRYLLTSVVTSKPTRTNLGWMRNCIDNLRAEIARELVCARYDDECDRHAANCQVANDIAERIIRLTSKPVDEGDPSEYQILKNQISGQLDACTNSAHRRDGLMRINPFSVLIGSSFSDDQGGSWTITGINNMEVVITNRVTNANVVRTVNGLHFGFQREYDWETIVLNPQAIEHSKGDIVRSILLAYQGA